MKQGRGILVTKEGDFKMKVNLKPLACFLAHLQKEQLTVQRQALNTQRRKEMRGNAECASKPRIFSFRSQRGGCFFLTEFFQTIGDSILSLFFSCSGLHVQQKIKRPTSTVQTCLRCTANMLIMADSTTCLGSDTKW